MEGSTSFWVAILLKVYLRSDKLIADFLDLKPLKYGPIMLKNFALERNILMLLLYIDLIICK